MRPKAGLIPAHAGKTLRTARRAESHTAHPRSRGENDGDDFADLVHQGSSPLTRGKPRAHATAAPGPGLIPAHAGKTGSRIRPSSDSRAHPRSRGENTS